MLERGSRHRVIFHEPLDADADGVSDQWEYEHFGVFTNHNGLVDVDGRCNQLYRLGPDGAVLVRPDGFVAWRSPSGAARPPGALAEAVAALRGG